MRGREAQGPRGLPRPALLAGRLLIYCDERRRHKEPRLGTVIPMALLDEPDLYLSSCIDLVKPKVSPSRRRDARCPSGAGLMRQSGASSTGAFDDWIGLLTRFHRPVLWSQPASIRPEWAGPLGTLQSYPRQHVCSEGEIRMWAVFQIARTEQAARFYL
jgi:hypothetical protein